MIKNIISGRAYIGATINLYQRIRTHYASLKSNSSDCIRLQIEFNSYPESFFEIIILVKFDNSIKKKQLLEEEKRQISLYNNLLNVTDNPKYNKNCPINIAADNFKKYRYEYGYCKNHITI